MMDAVNRLLKADYSRLWGALTGVIQDPQSNPTAFVLIIAAASIVLLVVVVALLGLLASGEDDEEYEAAEFEEEGPPTPSETSQAEASEPVEPPSPPSPVQRAAVTVVWVLAIVAIWVAGGVVSQEDTMCASCHEDGGIHVARVAGKGADPHETVQCAACHETPVLLARVTTAVPGRALHFLAAISGQKGLGTGYGTPVANSACRTCHVKALDSTFVDNVRGIRVSHVEPLAARALCRDCHAPRAGTGVIDRFTVGMEPCIRCHDGKHASAACTYCHTRDFAYAAQSRSVMKPSRLVKNIDCGGCHAQKRCDECHGMRMPHTEEFMGALHARQAAEDLWFNQGKVCGRCHTTTHRPCTRCHYGSSYPNETAHGRQSWPTDHATVDPYNNGCNGCHSRMAWMTGRQFCGLCHPEYTGAKPVKP